MSSKETPYSSLLIILFLLGNGKSKDFKMFSLESYLANGLIYAILLYLSKPYINV
jgi:hypothetical protein